MTGEVEHETNHTKNHMEESIDEENDIKKIHVKKGEKKVCCMFCEKKFHSKRDLVRHVRVHTGERPHTCEDCGKSFRHNSNYLYHKETHGERKKEFSCHKCAKSYYSYKSLEEHLKLHCSNESSKSSYSNEYKVDAIKRACEIGVSGAAKELNLFQSSLNTWIHMALKTRKNSHICHICNKTVIGPRTKLKRHLAVHERGGVTWEKKSPSFRQEVALFASQNTLTKASAKYNVSVATIWQYVQKYMPGGRDFKETSINIPNKSLTFE